MRPWLFHSYQKICWYVKIYWIKMTQIPCWSNWADGGISSHGKAQGQVCHMLIPCFDPFQNVILLSFMIKTGNRENSLSCAWKCMLWIQRSWVEIPLSPLTTLWSWVSRFIFLCFSTLIHKLGINCEIQWDDISKLMCWAHSSCSVNASHFY